MIESFLYIIAIISFSYLGKRYFSGGVCTSKNRLDGKVVIITGANCGIGYETALDLAKRGAHVILACRDLKKAKGAAYNIINESKNDKVEIEKLDLADFKTVREFCERIKSKFDKIDILINNAGLIFNDFLLTVDGNETTFQVNHLGHFLLTNLLLDLLLKSNSPRVVNVASRAHEFGVINWDDLNYEKNYSLNKTYQQSKIANILFAKELAKRYQDKNLIAVSLHPGAVRTEIFRAYKEKSKLNVFLIYAFAPFIYYFFKNVKQGAQTTIHCAIADDVAQYNGCCFRDCAPNYTSKEASNMESAKRLWEVSCKLVGI